MGCEVGHGSLRGPRGSWLEVGGGECIGAGLRGARVHVYHGEFGHEGFVAEGFADGGDVGFRHVISGYAWEVVVCAEEALLYDVLEAGLLDGVFCELAHVDGAELVDLRGDRVLFDEGLFGESKLERVVGGQGYVETAAEVAEEGVALVGEEESVVAQRGHGYADLLQVEDVL